jgi:hypothetical protein
MAPSPGRTKNKRTRIETIRKRQDENKAKFVAKLEETPIIQVAAAQTGIDRTTYYRWRNEDAEFREQCRAARNRGVDFVNDMMESILIKNAKNNNMTAVIFWLKNHSHEYNDKRYHEHEHHFREPVLTEERKKEIAMTMQKWSEPVEGDERDEDYELKKEE